MPLPILGLVAAGVSITWKTVALVLGGGTVIAAGGKAVYEAGKAKGEYEGEKTGRIEQSKVDELKFRMQAEEMLKQQKTYEKASKEWDEILRYYEDYIDAMSKKYNPTEEEKVELELMIKEYEALRQLKDETSEKEVDEAVYDVVIWDVGTNKVGAVKLVKELTNMGLADAKKAVDKIPCTIMKSVSVSYAEKIKKQFAEIGVRVWIKTIDEK